MLRTVRRTAVAAVAVAMLGACGAERTAPIATRPPGPVTTTTDRDRPREREAVSKPTRRVERERSETSEPTETTEATTTTIAGLASPEAWEAFDEALAGRLIGGGDHAAAVAIAVHGEIVHQAEFGYRVPLPAPAPPVDPTATTIDPTTVPPSTVPPSPVPPPTVEPPELIERGDRFRIASISKVITAIVVLQLVEAGQIQLDQPVGAALAEHVGAAIVDPAVAGITVRRLLSHTAGFPTYERTFFGGQVDSCAAAAQVGLSSGLAAAPGTSYRYSNLNFCLLGLLIEQVAGRPYEAVVKDRLLQPLGIEGMRLAGTFDPDPSEVIHPSAPLRNYMETLGAAGSWVATPSDVVTIIDALDPTTPGWHPLSPPMMELMRQPSPVVYPSQARWYGLGLMAFEDGSFGHTGTVESTHAMVVDRPDGVTWSVLVSGEYPWESSDLRGIVERSLADAGIALA